MQRRCRACKERARRGLDAVACLCQMVFDWRQDYATPRGVPVPGHREREVGALRHRRVAARRAEQHECIRRDRRARRRAKAEGLPGPTRTWGGVSGRRPYGRWIRNGR